MSKRVVRVARPEAIAVVAFAALLDLWALGRNGWANDYYSAAVRSMSGSWHAFLYGSFDRGGLMTVDKPPLALWIQAVSVRVFGFRPLAILVPQALMGVAAVGLTYDLVRRPFGRLAGAVAGLVLALTPITVAISRHNNPDALLILCCVAAVWCVVRGLEDGRTRWIVLAGVCAGLGFETKMGAALLVVPALAAAWLWAAPRGRPGAVRQLLLGGAAMVVVGGAWPLLVALTPAADRPWVSGTSDDSIWSLVVDYNGLGRLEGQSGGPGTLGGGSGVLRLLEAPIGGQGGWLLGVALVGGAGILVASRLQRADARSGWLIAVGGAFLTCAVAFSLARGIFHPYYVSELAPFAAALVGACVAQIAAGGQAARVIGPLAVVAGAAGEIVVVGDGARDLRRLVPVLAVTGVSAAVALALPLPPRVRGPAAAVALGALLIGPASWAFDTLGHATGGTFPAGGPAGAAFVPAEGLGAAAPASVAGGGGPFGTANVQLLRAVLHARAHGGGPVAVSSQARAAIPIITAGARVAGIGGFSGHESAVSLAWLRQAVAAGRVRWVLADDPPRADRRPGAAAAMAAVRRGCTAVTDYRLYDCRGRAAALGG